MAAVKRPPPSGPGKIPINSQTADIGPVATLGIKFYNNLHSEGSQAGMTSLVGNEWSGEMSHEGTKVPIDL